MTEQMGNLKRNRLFCGACILLMFIAAGGCSDQGMGPEAGPGSREKVVYDGFGIPVFETATDQLNYARSLFSNPKEKSAALKVLIERFPEDREKRGEARLELAYLHLGDDFRLAGSNACRQALADYESIAKDYEDLSSVAIKAYWYMAWIYTDLLSDKKRGVAMYSILAENYPENSFSRISPVPWLDLIFPGPRTKPYTADDRHVYSWAGLALLEIVRNTDNESKRMAAFQKLWKQHPKSLATGFALKEMLRHAASSDDFAGEVDAYIKINTVNPALNKDLVAMCP